MAGRGILQIDGDGALIECAKGASAGNCGYKTGARLCQKCGAVAITVKANASPEMEEDAEDMMDEAPEETEAKPTRRKPVMMSAVEDDEGPMEEEAEEGAEEMEDEATRKGWLTSRARRMGRMKSMGIDPDDFDDDAYVCGISRKVHDGGQEPCSMCHGGCASDDGALTLLDIEGIAEAMFDGKVLASGYASDVDVFVVDLKGADGKIREAFFNGEDGECFRWGLQDETQISEKSLLLDDPDVISPEQARIVALEHVEGKAVLVDVDRLGDDFVYVVEIEGDDDFSYDAYVSVKGEFIDYESYSPDEVADINAEVAEIHFKRMYTEEQRTQMAEDGTALPDGSYPIKDEGDLRNAIQAFGRAKDKDKAKAHIKKRAADLGLEDMIPENWMGGDKMMGADEAEGFEGMAKPKKKPMEGEKSGDPEILASLMEFELLVVEEELKDIL